MGVCSAPSVAMEMTSSISIGELPRHPATLQTVTQKRGKRQSGLADHWMSRTGCSSYSYVASQDMSQKIPQRPFSVVIFAT